MGVVVLVLATLLGCISWRGKRGRACLRAGGCASRAGGRACGRAGVLAGGRAGLRAGGRAGWRAAAAGRMVAIQRARARMTAEKAAAHDVVAEFEARQVRRRLYCTVLY